MSRHRREHARARHGRTALASTVITTVALLGGMGMMPQGVDIATSDTAALGVPDRLEGPSDARRGGSRPPRTSQRIAPAMLFEASSEVPPPDSGEGRRVVYSEKEQRVWLISEDEEVERSYLVSGSVYDNLHPGTYAVYSRSEQAWGIDDSGTMRWFVRFTQGENAAIGFHDIPIDDGELVQTKDDLGTPTSHGCIRQKSKDARALWDFAPIGTTVVVI